MEDRRAHFRTVVALAMPGGEGLVVEGSLQGVIATSPRGDDGFGYDPVFEVDGRTLAEMGAELKNTMSHRARALRALAEALGVSRS
jgi:XTP/dITP diphosphohydrolase